MSSKQLYVIFRGCHTDWYIPVKDINEGLGLKIFINTWAPDRELKVDITTELRTKRNSKIEHFPEGYIDMFRNLKSNILR